ncbi:MAG: hypothetical protein HY092_02975 [Candidatus Kerfeldbacteria bacterium]|nr:hypothetical protein [Candidatus Kerfeldbacteria bacterium]
MKLHVRQKTFKAAAILAFIGVLLCTAGPAIAAGGHQVMSEAASCQTMHFSLVGFNPDILLLGPITFFLFALPLIHSFSRRGKRLMQEVATALSPPPGSRWRLFEHAFFDTLYRQFSPALQYVAVAVEPQTYFA